MDFLDAALRPYQPSRWSRAHVPTAGPRPALGFALLVTVLSAALVASGTFFWIAAAGSARTPDPYVALYERADGSAVPVGSLTCPLLAEDLHLLGTPVSGSGNAWGPAGLGKPYAVRDAVAEIAALPKGDVRRRLISCDSRAHWSSIQTRKVRFSLDIDGGVARAEDASLTIRR